jgi:hypothetical protein
LGVLFAQIVLFQRGFVFLPLYLQTSCHLSLLIGVCRYYITVFQSAIGITNDGNVYADGTYQSPAADFAEMLPTHDDLEPGDVLVIAQDGKLTRSTQSYQSTVIGVYSTKPGFLGGTNNGVDLAGSVPLAIAGIVPVKVSVENGSIYPGDLLTTSGTPGHAMLCNDRLACVGAIIGKALEPLEGVLVSFRC